MAELFSLSALIAFAQVITIDLLLAVDNAIVVGLVAAGLPLEQRKRVIMLGIVFATAFRIMFALVTTYLLMIVGLLLAGGLLLLWVTWKMFREVHRERQAHKVKEKPVHPPKSFSQAVVQVILADVGMSLDNVLGVAGAARDHFWVLVFGLVLSVFLMGWTSTRLANLLNRHRWLVYIGIGVVLMVALEMIWSGIIQIRDGIMV